ncbi:hypothetical protein H114_32644 [Streptomyces gancidicus BKS 13-15]|uniref:Uncharacterized protein n=1 Tax=Streptomyces gancidicus BKS 13-15 TaxID=1284664 RepID=M3CSA5_STREZ|nr:hypothetical protein [Streptomyces gancidicus]EMF20390.1 hypothetical protein H114_32644 [Streptomyces gancidicus BKS 13-15]
MPDLTTAQPGDRLILVHEARNMPDTDVTVSRVGRRYLYVAYSNGLEARGKYDRTTGRGADDHALYSAVYTPEQLADRTEGEHLRRELRDRGLTVDPNRNLTTAVLRRLLAVLLDT